MVDFNAPSADAARCLKERRHWHSTCECIVAAGPSSAIMTVAIKLSNRRVT